MSSGKSRHLSENRNSHEDCKSAYLAAKEDSEAKGSSKTISKVKTMMKSEVAHSFRSNSPYGHNKDILLAKDEEVPETPFTVKLCCKCQRSVKFRKKPRSPPTIKKRVSSLEE